ncbi:MAG TPA: hypothetical protein VFP55_12185 [Solirubrobacteraceae bacterium]|nr:hypothetical protein [Solirubrobacteraceae bacterium]
MIFLLLILMVAIAVPVLAAVLLRGMALTVRGVFRVFAALAQSARPLLPALTQAPRRVRKLELKR